MFEDLHQEDKNQSVPAQAQDIFSDADPVKERHVLKPAPFQPKAVPTPSPAIAADAPQPAMASPYGEEDSGNGKKFFILGLTILVMAGVVFGLFSAFSKFGNPFAKKQAAVTEEQPKTDELPAAPAAAENKQTQPNPIIPAENKNTVPAAEEPQTPIVPQVAISKDSDQDGLTDDEEMNVYHTNQNLTDTDEDGLFDREEAKVYRTNPLSKDTDGDGYTDGAEVKGGYNPNGPGKLYDITKP